MTMFVRFLAVLALALPMGSATASPIPSLGFLPPSFRLVAHGFAGGTIWEGRIPDHVVVDPRLADVYLPPGYSPAQSYPVLYLLHGFWGSPGSFVRGLHLADTADAEITSGRAGPFIAVMPPGGPMTKTTSDEWAGRWESYVVENVVPWVDSHLAADPQERTVAGLSSGGYGAVDIGLRHLGMFGTLESWGGYFKPFRDGPFTFASQAVLDAHDPVLLVRKEAAKLRRDHVRIFLSTGRTGHGPVSARWTFRFSDELASLHIAHKLWVLPKSKHGHFWRNQLPAAIDYAIPG
jgi:Putative esterase